MTEIERLRADNVALEKKLTDAHETLGLFIALTSQSINSLRQAVNDLHELAPAKATAADECVRKFEGLLAVVAAAPTSKSVN